MAKYFLHIKTFSRSSGARATRAAAYRSGERIRDERTRKSYNFSNRRDVVHKGILLPSQFQGRADMDWARDRSTLWNAAEYAGRQRNSRVAREVLVNLPPELTSDQRLSLVRSYSQTLANRYRTAVDFAIHEPRIGSDERHHHAHLLMTTREVTPDGLGRRAALELSGTERHQRGLGPARDEYPLIRERWAYLTNEALREAGLSARVDHRSYKDQGLNLEPTPRMPQKIYYAERGSGMGTPAGDAIRAEYRQRVEARQKGPDELALVLRTQNEARRQRAIERAVQGEVHGRDRADPIADHSPLTTAEEAVRNWRAFRREENDSPTAEQSVAEWWAYRERAKQDDASHTAHEERALTGSQERAHQHEGRDDDREQHADVGLELDAGL